MEVESGVVDHAGAPPGRDCVIRPIVTGRSGNVTADSGIVTADSGIVTDRSGIVTGGVLEGFEGCV
jgi:hypothetical protein